MAVKRMKEYKGKPRLSRRKMLLAGLPLVVLAAIALLWWYDASTGAKGRTVEVTFTDAAGEGLPDMLVSGLIDTGRTPMDAWNRQGTSTDSTGRCIFENVSPGAYWLRAGETAYTIAVSSGAQQVVRQTFVYDADHPRTYDVELVVTDMDGKPAAGQEVKGSPRALETGGVGQAVPVGVTDWRGTVYWQDIQAGGHLVRVGDVWYPLVVEPTDASTLRVTLTWGSHATEETYMRHVTFLSAGGKPLAGKAVEEVLYGVPSGKEFVISSFVTDQNGGIELRDIQPGKHTLRLGNQRFSFDIPLKDAPTTDAVVFRQ